MNGFLDLGIKPRIRGSDPLRMERVRVSAWGCGGLKLLYLCFCIFEFNDSGSGLYMVVILSLSKHQNRKRV